MVDSKLNKIFQAKLTDAEFDKLSKFIYNEAGIKMPKVKKIMLQSRLQKRLRTLGITSFKEYIDYIFSKEGMESEIIHMLDVVSTNKTDFFREPGHFDFLRDQILPEALSSTHFQKSLKIWSAACSSGEEAYTISIVINEFMRKNSTIDYSILGTDISTQILQMAVNAIYKEERVENIPLELKKKYFLKSKDRTNPTVRVVPELRRRVKFSRLNFMNDTYDVQGTVFDIVFCRNVLIYFDRETQEKVINKLCQRLKSGGYFFLGHSESIMNMNVPLEQIKPTIFRRV